MPVAHMLVTVDRLQDYRHWHAAQVASGDLDPMYPVLRRLSDKWGLSQEEKAWLCVLHTVWYFPGSTVAAFAQAPEVGALPRTAQGLGDAGLLSLPTGTERRGHRTTGPLVSHLLALPVAFQAGVDPWVRPEDGWEAVNLRLTSITGIGRWAAYKLSEMWQKVAGYPLVATDAGHRYSSGPRKGLADLFPGVPTGNDAATVQRLDDLTSDLASEIGEQDVAQVETSLCDFHSLVKGNYYLGHDIDYMQAAFLHPRVPPVPAEAWEARSESFPQKFLGEVGGWTGTRRELKPLYRDYGVIFGAEA